MQINFSWRILEEKKGRSQAAVSIAHQGRRTRLVCFRGIYKKPHQSFILHQQLKA